MHVDSTFGLFAACRARTVVAGSVLAAALGCVPMDGGDGNGQGNNNPKNVRVQFETFDVGSDDCEDIFSFGDFLVQMTVTVQPRNEAVFTASRGLELGSASFQAPVQSADLSRTAEFALEEGESVEVEIRVTEDDPINSDEPQPWDDAEDFDYASVTNESFSFTNGPGCFADDRIDVTISATE